MASLFSFGRPFAGIAGRKGAGRGMFRPRSGGDPRENDGDAPAPGKGSLSAVVEREIIPRLIAAHPRESRPPVRGAAPAILRGEVENFTSLVLTAEADVLLDYVDQICARGTGAEAVLVELLAPTARGSASFGSRIIATSSM